MSRASKHIADLAPEAKRALLAQLLQKKAGESTAVYPLSYGQRALWFLHQLAPESWAYNVLFAARIQSDVALPSLRHALQALVDRHAVLRTTYFVRHDEPVQQVHRHMPVHLEKSDVSTWSQQ